MLFKKTQMLFFQNDFNLVLIDQGWLNQACFMITCNHFVCGGRNVMCRTLLLISVFCRPTPALPRNLLEIQNLRHARCTELECQYILLKLTPNFFTSIYFFWLNLIVSLISLVKKTYVVAFCLPFLFALLQEANDISLTYYLSCQFSIVKFPFAICN